MVKSQSEFNPSESPTRECIRFQAKARVTVVLTYNNLWLKFHPGMQTLGALFLFTQREISTTTSRRKLTAVVAQMQETIRNVEDQERATPPEACGLGE